MTRTSFTAARRLLAGAAAAPTVAVAAFTLPTPDRVPAALDPGPRAALALTMAARGVQIYECRRAGANGDPAWAFVAPDAELLDPRGQVIGHHGAGPFWQASDGSRIVGQLQARADAPSTDAIAWLLLSAQPAGPAGVFSRVTRVQRINTAGGLAPRTACTAEALGQTARVPYTADYQFFSQR